MSETYFSGDNSRTMRDMRGSTKAQAQADFQRLRDKFPWVRPSDYFSVSTPAFHEVLGEEVVTACLPLPATDALAGQDYALGNRKFCMRSGTSFLRLYKLFTGERPDWLPPSSTIMFMGENHEEFRRPFPDKAKTFYDLYFSGDCAEVEAAFGLPERRGVYQTFYGATVVDGKPVRIKQYLYDDQTTFSDWDVVWMVNCKKQGREDLMGLAPEPE